MNLSKPFEGSYPITQYFGEKYEYNGKTLKHEGVDFATPKNTPIIAPMDGVVYRIEKWRLTGYGKTVYVRGLDGVSTYFVAHLNSINVELNQRVYKNGTILGHSGRTGFWRGKTGYHLHFSLLINNKYVDPLNYMEGYKNNLINNEELKKLDVKNNDDRYYKVKKGESLWIIAGKLYGDNNKWFEIYNENKKLIGDNPDLIYPGQRLRLPKK